MRTLALGLCTFLAAAVCAAPARITQADWRGLGVDPVALLEGAALFSQGMRIYRDVTAREARHKAELARRGVAEVPASREAVKYVIDTGGLGEMLVDDWGELYVDRRFLTDDELKTVKRIEAFVWEHVVVPMQKAKVLPAPGTPSSAKPTAVVNVEKRAPRVRAGGAGLPVFRGFEDARYQQHDALIARLTADFNANKAVWCGGTAAQAAKIADLSPAMVKSHMIEESGGSGPRSRAAWSADPLQVNVPGDWGEEKRLVGLSKPSGRNEGNVADNVKAAIMYLSRKGFSAAARPAAERPKGFFDGWLKAFTRYNGRRDRTETDRFYSDEYADKILKRAADPDLFVPIEIRLAR